MSLVRAEVPRQFGLLEEMVKCDEASQRGGIFLGPTQVLEKRTGHVGPTCEDQPRRLIVIHRLRHPNGKPQITGGAVGGKRNATESIDNRLVAASPTQLRVFGIGIDAVVEYDVQRGLEAELGKKLW